jgi:hypothetical protein
VLLSAELCCFLELLEGRVLIELTGRQKSSVKVNT